ncbi:molecular chaperone DnaJ [Dactylosporangium sp. NPDC049525]|uniref:molecular chaperone DnaJ n=1 Tax=Dactylosporangium sp. NPDC049525 TaxID=3154730 RepID=UPI003449F082
MCNPRRIDVQATRLLAEEWQRQVERVVSLSGEARAEARIRESLSATVARPTLAALERILDRSDEWTADGDGYTLALDGGFVRYLPETRELELVAYLAEQVTGVGRSERELSGRIEETLTAAGRGDYYDDEFGGEARARDAAAVAAARSLDALADERRERAYAEAAAAHAAELDAAATERAKADLARARAQRTADLARGAESRLLMIGVTGRNAFHRVLAEAYRDAILAYARVHGAERLSVSERDGTVEIQFEMTV